MRCLTGWLLACLAVAAHASPACDVAPDGQTLEAALTTLRSLERQCHKHAPFLYELGRLLNLTGRYEEAVDPLEGALLYRPDHWPSQLEYAIALEGTGDHSAALALLQNLASNPSVDTAARQQIATLVQTQSSTLFSERRGTFNLATGYDDNLLGNTYHTQIDLTTLTGSFPAELDESQRPRAGVFARADVSYDGLLISNADARWHYSLQGSYRTSPAYTSADTLQWGIALERRTPSGQGPYVLGQYQQLHRINNTGIRQTQLALGYEFAEDPVLACRHRLGLDIQLLDYPSSTSQNGHYTGVVSYTNCPAWGLQVQLRAGQEQPKENNRPGGTQDQYNLRVNKRTQIKAAYLSQEWEATRQQDQSGYSPLLNNNAARTINRFAYRLEYRWIAGQISPYIGFEWLEQRANVSLFELSNRVLTVGFRSTW